jgi:hypothetical protein
MNGGYSGGSTDRPDLQRLLDDIRARKLDVIVVYKVDRLTRSQADFAKLVELFDTHGVSFVSVTQQFRCETSGSGISEPNQDCSRRVQPVAAFSSAVARCSTCCAIVSMSVRSNTKTRSCPANSPRLWIERYSMRSRGRLVSFLLRKAFRAALISPAFRHRAISTSYCSSTRRACSTVLTRSITACR